MAVNEYIPLKNVDTRPFHVATLPTFPCPPGGNGILANSSRTSLARSLVLCDLALETGGCKPANQAYWVQSGFNWRRRKYRLKVLPKAPACLLLSDTSMLSRLSSYITNFIWLRHRVYASKAFKSCLLIVFMSLLACPCSRHLHIHLPAPCLAFAHTLSLCKLSGCGC